GQEEDGDSGHARGRGSWCVPVPRRHASRASSVFLPGGGPWAVGSAGPGKVTGRTTSGERRPVSSWQALPHVARMSSVGRRVACDPPLTAGGSVRWGPDG